MDNQNDKSGLAAVAAASDAVSKTDHAAALASATTAATADGVKQGSNAAHSRIKAILGSEQAKGRDGLTSHLAFDTEMTVEQALAVLDKSPKAEAPKTGSRLDAIVPQPKVEASDKSKLAPADVLAAAMDRQIARQFPGYKAA